MMLKDKTVLITGVNRGLGRALASAFIAEQCIVIGIARNSRALDSLSLELENASFYPYVADLSDSSALSAAFQQIVAEHEHIDILFNNAAVYPRENFLNESPENFASAIATNVCGMASLCKLVLPKMIEQGYGRIYNLGSFADISPIANSAAYSASKGAVHALTKAIAADIDDLGLDIQVHEWIPGHLDTDMGSKDGIDPKISAQWAVKIASGQVSSSGKSVIFMNDAELPTPRSLKQRIQAKLFFWQRP